jgi:uncharacterized protein YndB with AHSA1/START domain
MKFSTKEDVDVPIASVWDMVTEVEAFERAAMRRGAEVQRLVTSAEPVVGMSWRTRFPYRGKEREIDVVIERLDAPNELFLVFGSASLTGSLQVELMALSPTRTRMLIALELKPLNLSARLLVQSLKLAKSTLTKRYKLRVADYSKVIEERFATYG